MSSVLPVGLNRGRLHRIEVDDEVTVSGSFTIGLQNHGRAVHVHLNADDDLASVVRLGATNHYVESDARRDVTVDVRAVEEPVTGRLKLVTGYGSEMEYVTVTVAPPEEEESTVDVDETLNRPQTEDESGDGPGLGSRLRRSIRHDLSLPVVGFGVVAIGVALAFGLAIGTPPVLLGAGIVIGVVLSTVVYLAR